MTDAKNNPWQLARGRSITLDRPLVMAILNVTPDSFSDGGELSSIDRVLERARAAAQAGAGMLDIGGESTRPGAERISALEQIERVVPAIEAIRRDPSLDAIPISIDTTLAKVARSAIDAGADAINDVSGASEDPAILSLAAEHSAGLVLMHRLTTPERDRYSDQYRAKPSYEGDVVTHISNALRAMRERAIEAGCEPDAIVLDPGLGFGKSVEQNLELIRGTPTLVEIGSPILSGVSRKSFIGRIAHPDVAQTEPSQRLAGTLSLSALHLALGARVFRVHDVGPVRESLDAAWALIERGRLGVRMLPDAAGPEA